MFRKHSATEIGLISSQNTSLLPLLSQKGSINRPHSEKFQEKERHKRCKIVDLIRFKEIFFK
jgi:hypothetical protein